MIYWNWFSLTCRWEFGVKRNTSNTSSNTHFSTHSFWLVKIYIGSTKLCGFHMNLVGFIWISTNQRECVKKCVLECVLLAFLAGVKW